MSFGKLIFRTFIFSFLLSILFMGIYADIRRSKSTLDDLSYGRWMILSGCFCIILAVTIISIPGALLARYLKNKRLIALPFYFLAPVVAFILVLLSSADGSDKQCFSIIIASYILVSGFFFLKNRH
jgi:hypothetical protein